MTVAGACTCAEVLSHGNRCKLAGWPMPVSAGTVCVPAGRFPLIDWMEQLARSRACGSGHASAPVSDGLLQKGALQGDLLETKTQHHKSELPQPVVQMFGLCGSLVPAVQPWANPLDLQQTLFCRACIPSLEPEHRLLAQDVAERLFELVLLPAGVEV